MDQEIDAESLTAELIRKMTHPDDQDRVLQNTENALKEGKVKLIEYRIIRSDKTERVVLAESELTLDVKHKKPNRIVGIVQDITKRKKAEKAIKESEKK